MSFPDVQELLARVGEIRKKHELIAEMTGEGFNVFEILRLRTNEARTHSAFLRELLDPRGSHGLKDAFLKAFIRMVRETVNRMKISGERIIEPDGKSWLMAKVSVEQFVGYKSDDCSTGGRIDIAVELRNGAPNILIENKIYANDQECQLVRYHNHDKEALLLYLTLEGREASKFSASNAVSGDDLVSGRDYFAISYKSDIIRWLEDCLKEATGHPLVRETIIQYANLIRSLTQQNRSNQMNDDIKNAVVRNKEGLLAYHAIVGAQEAVIKGIHQRIEDQLAAVAKEFVGLYFDEYNPGVEFFYSNAALQSANLQIGFRCEQGKWFFGLCNDAAKRPIPAEVPKIWPVSLGDPKTESPWWPVWWSWKEYEKLWDGDMLASILFDPSDEKQAAGTGHTKFQRDVAGKIDAILSALPQELR